MHPPSALPGFYFFCFAIYEPFLTTAGFFATLRDPLTAHNSQAPWPVGSVPFDSLPPPTLVSMVQLAHACALLGIINAFVLSAVRAQIKHSPQLQEKIAFSLLAPLLGGDIIHISITLWSLGDLRWQISRWTPLLWTTILLGLSLLIPRACWHLGIGRYVHTRDGPAQNPATHPAIASQKR